MIFRRWDGGRFAVAICLIVLAVRGADKKMIGHSWDLLAVRPADVVRNLDAWEQVPLDGISLSLAKTVPDGRQITFGTIMNDPPWDRQWFAEELEVLRQCSSRNLKHNFMTTFWAPRTRLAWNDDAAWAQFAHNIGVMAWLAKEGQTKGILIDSEDYPESRQFFWVTNDVPYAEAIVLARQRGAQMMASMAAEYPDITLLTFCLLNLRPNCLADDDPLAMAAEIGDLWFPFFNGMLDAAPPGVRLIEGDGHAYFYEAAKNDFYMGCWRTQNNALKVVDPVNRMKYQTQVLSGFGLYLDMYTNPFQELWYFGELDGSRLNHLRSNFAQALHAAQEYVWLYGEKMDWIKWKGTNREKNPTWEERLPGFNSTLGQLRDPRLWAEQMVEQQRQAGTLSNCLVNGACVLEKAETPETFRQEVLPAGWWFSREANKRIGAFKTTIPKGLKEDHKRPGVFGTESSKGRGDDFSLCAVGVGYGYFGTSVQTSPGKRFVVDAYMQGVAPKLTVGWKRAGEWDWSIKGVTLRFAAAESDGWQHAIGLVQVPEGADELVVMLNVQQGEGERTWCDAVGLYSLTDQ